MLYLWPTPARPNYLASYKKKFVSSARINPNADKSNQLLLTKSNLIKDFVIIFSSTEKLPKNTPFFQIINYVENFKVVLLLNVFHMNFNTEYSYYIKICKCSMQPHCIVLDCQGVNIVEYFLGWRGGMCSLIKVKNMLCADFY